MATDPEALRRERILSSKLYFNIPLSKVSIIYSSANDISFMGIEKLLVLYPFRKQVGGTILAAKLAKERGWAINVGGGFHHCTGERGGGFCAFADISLCIYFAFLRPRISRKRRRKLVLTYVTSDVLLLKDRRSYVMIDTLCRRVHEVERQSYSRIH